MIAVLIAHSATVISPGSKVLVVGSGPVCLCAAKLAAVRGFSTTCLVPPGDCELGPGLVSEGGDLGSLPLTFMPVAGPEASEEAIEAAAASAEGLILAIDNEGAFGKPVLETFLQPSSALKRVAVMSRYLNGEGMGFFASAAKTAANKDVWAANAQAVASYKAMEAEVARMSGAAGVEWTVIRAGTLKGGGSGCSGEEGDERSGEPSLLTPAFYELGQQDIVNWRLLYDCSALKVKLVRGDTLPGPGFTAALTATDKVGAGDSHRGAVAAALVEALRSPDAANRDYSVAAEEGREFPGEKEWSHLFEAAH